MMDAREVVELVTAAFRETTVPPADLLLNQHCCECLETSEAFAGKPWTDISLEQLLVGRETALLTPEAWRYYLPAVILWCVRAPDVVDVIQDNLVYQLTPPTEDGGVPGWFEPRARGFDAAQRHAIVAYLEWSRERLEASWTRFGGTPPDDIYRALEFWRKPDGAA
jgi:hypothetical protein